MIDHSTVAAWVDRYVQAWNSNDPDDIGGLFSDDALYYTSPFRAPWTGRAAIVKGWIGRQDERGDTTFRYEVLATSDSTGIVRGWTHYHNQPAEYSNIWLIRFDAQGDCTEFTEWWMERDASS